jgi:hypothetical protein
VWGYAFHALTLFSAFYVGFLSVTRSYVLLRPLSRIHKSTIGGVALGHFFSQSLLSTLVFWDGGRYQYKREYVECSAHTSSGRSYHVLEHVGGMVTYVAPIFPILLSSVLTAWKLRKNQQLHGLDRSSEPARSREGPRTGPGRGREKVRLSSVYGPLEVWIARHKAEVHVKRRSSVTILIFSAVYAVFNIPMAVCYIFHAIDEGNGFLFDRPGFYFTSLVYNLAVPLNSLVNPIIYFVRVKGFRSFILGYVRRAMQFCKMPTYF